MSDLPTNLLRLMDERGFNPRSLSKAAKLNETAVRDIIERRSKNPRRDTLTKLADALRCSLAELLGGEADGFLAQPVEIEQRAEMPRNLPVYGNAIGGDDGAFQMNGETMSYVERPTTLAGVKNAYGVYASGTSMSPRFEPGWLLWVNPVRPVRQGDNVVVQIKPKQEGDPPLAFVKVFERRTPNKLVCSQLNPVMDLEWDLKSVVSVHRVVGVGEM
jgi:phage repressor protein C with HTH and peptisase S24 domain